MAEQQTTTRKRHNIKIGNLYGLLCVIDGPFRDVARQATEWTCRCECGLVRNYLQSNLCANRSQSCGCRKPKPRKDGHGETRSAEYRCWNGMMGRCYNGNTSGFKNYGGRGIRVCRRWVRSYMAFLKDMGRKPSPSHSLDRIDVNGNYQPSNCRWATALQQGRNKRNSVLVEFQGQHKTCDEWATISGLGRSTLLMRILAGWSVADAILHPVKKGPCNCDMCIRRLEDSRRTRFAKLQLERQAEAEIIPASTAPAQESVIEPLPAPRAETHDTPPPLRMHTIDAIKTKQLPTGWAHKRVRDLEQFYSNRRRANP